MIDMDIQEIDKNKDLKNTEIDQKKEDSNDQLEEKREKEVKEEIVFSWQGLILTGKEHF